MKEESLILKSLLSSLNGSSLIKASGFFIVYNFQKKDISQKNQSPI